MSCGFEVVTMSWLRVRTPHFRRGLVIVDLSKVATLHVVENEKNAVIELRSTNDTTLATLIVNKNQLEETIDALTLLIEQSKQFSDAKILTLEEVLQAKPQGVWA